jgi:choline dehydrogenase-like flavoprotein
MATKPLRIAIIGSGLGGAVLADLLAGHHEVTVFERGPNAPCPPQPAAMTSHPFGLYPSFAYGLGGTTNYWHGGLVEMLEGEMGAAWPDALKSELPRYYAGVVRHLYNNDQLRGWQTREQAEFVDGVLPTQLLYAHRPFRSANSGFLTMGRVLTGHRVERVEERAGGVDVVSRAAGQQITEHFDRVVIAAGGLNSPVILQNAGLGGPEVGHNFTDHPMGFVAKLRAATPSDVFLRLRAKGALHSKSEAMLKVRDAETGLWSAFYLRAAFGSRLASDPYSRSFKVLAQTNRVDKYLAALPQLHDPDFLWKAFESQLHIALPSSLAYVLVVNEQEAMGQGTVRADKDGRLEVDWRISDAVEGAIRRNLVRLAAHTGAELLLPDGSLRDRLWSGAHHSGTCRISPDADTGVVDRDLRVHGTAHVYVCDGSVLPSTGASNTGLTIAALAHRLAERLRDEPRRRQASPKRKCLLISGATGAVGRMMRARLAGLGFKWRDVDLHNCDVGASERLEGSAFLHLANAHQSVEENIRLQERAASLVDKVGIQQVIVPMSTSTIEAIGPEGPRADAENFGFRYSGLDPYPEGKLAAERFWLDWQSAKPGRQLALVYIPTIIGPRSKWTCNIANHAPGKTLAVPRLERFFAVTETHLVDFLSTLFKAGLADSVNRHLVVSSSRSLAEAILVDRGGDVKVVRLPRFLWSMVSLSHGSGMFNSALSAIRVLTDQLLQRTLGYAMIPVSPRYLHLFRSQSDMAETIEAAAGKDDWGRPQAHSVRQMRLESASAQQGVSPEAQP